MSRAASGSGLVASGKVVGEILDRQVHPLAARAEGVDDLVARDGIEPGAQRLVLAPGLPLEVDGEQDLLHHVLAGVVPERRAARAHHAPEDRA